MKIVIDAGHGGKDSGAIGKGYIEKDQALAIALNIQRECIETGKKAYLTRSDDRFVELKNRIKNLNKDDVFISVHFNASKFHQGEGFEIYTIKDPSKETKELEDRIYSEIVALNEKYKINNRGKKESDFFVLKNAKCRAVLIEVLFIDNQRDMNKIIGTNYYRNLAVAIAGAI